MADPASTPVVVLGGSRHGALGIVRSLGRLGAPVYVVHPDRMAPAFFSRYCHARLLWDVDTATAEDSLRLLKALHERIGRRAVLIATSDLSTLFIVDHAEQLGEWYIFPAQDRGLIRALCSKKEMYFLAKKCGVPTPETTFPQSTADVRKFVATARFPLLLKPISSGPNAPPFRLVHGKDELLWHYRGCKDPSNVMIQEYIPGGDEMTWTFNGYFDRQGQCAVAFTGRKLRNFRPYFGMASLGVCVHNAEVESTTIEFMKAVGYRGPLDLGYRYDARDGRYKVNDINPRIGAMFRLFVGTNGVDVARALYQDMSGQQVSPARAPEGRKWIVEDRDFISALVYLRDGRLSFRDWRRSLHGIQETSFFAADDLWPVGGALGHNIRAVLSRIARIRERRANRLRWAEQPQTTS